MENFPPDHSALEDYLQSLNHLFVDITRLTYEQGYEEIVGGYCELRIATLDSGRPTAKLVAAKKLRLGTRQTTPKRLAFRLARELKVWAALQHPHILPLEGFYLCDEYKTAVLISEYMGHGELKNYIANMKPSLEERLSLVRDLTSGLAYLHTRDAPIRHGDLKPGNVLVNSDRRALLADFGLSKALDTGPTGFTTGNDIRGTTRYSGPEILLLGKPAESLANDIWSWACLVLEALTDKIPFADIQLEHQVILALAQSRSPFEVINTPLYPQQLKNLLTLCLSHEPEDRPTASVCLGIMESTLLGLKADSSDEFTPRLPEEGQDLVRRSGRATGTVTEDDKIDSTEEISPSLLLTGVVTSRIRPRNSSIGSVDEPGSATSRSDPLDETTTTKRRRRLSTDEADSIEVAVEGERQRKRIRADAGPAALSTSAAPNIARRDSARLNESPGGQSPQFEFPYNQPQNGQTDMPPPLEYGLPKPPGTEPRQRGSEAGIVPPQLHIAERQYQGTRHGPRGNSDFTLASALAPTSAVPTPMTHRSPIPSGSKDSSVKSPYPRHAQLYARSSGDIRVGSFEISGGIMGGPRTDSQHTGINLNQMDPSAAPTGAAQGSQPQGQVAQGTKMAMNLWQALGPTLLASLRPAPFTSSSLDEPPPPIDSGRRFPFERQDSAMSVEGRDKDRSLGMPRQELGNRGRSQQLQYPGPGPAVKPTLNAQGQRTCRQCGQPGRYKDGKCVEKWGPGPAGPGTLCERCRRKMKRVERRGTQDAGFLGQQIPLQALSSTQPQPPQLSPRQYYPPQSQPSYPREGQQYSLGEATPAREFQFQPPLSANSPTWVQGSKDWNTEGSYAWTGNITSPTSLQPKSNQPAPAKPQKRRAQTFSPPASPPLAD